MRTIRSSVSLLGLAAALALAGCGDQPAATPVQEVPAAMHVIAGDGQAGPPNTELANPITVQVTNAQGQPVQGQLVIFKVTAGGGSLYAGASITNAQGIARDRWTLGGTVGTQQSVEARAVDNGSGERLLFATFGADIVPGAPHQVANALQGPITAAVGYVAKDSAVVLVTDATGNPVPGVTVGWTVLSGGGRLPTGGTGTSVTNAHGKAHMWWVMGNIVGENQLRASVGSLAPVVFSVTPQHGSAVRIQAAVDSLRLDALVYNFPLPLVRGVDRFGNQFEVPLVWSSLNQSVVRMQSFTPWAVAQGTAPMVVKYNSLADTVVVVVDQVVDKVTISVGTRTHFFVGETFAPTFTYHDRTNNPISNAGATFSSSNTSVATVNASNGSFTGVAPGFFQLIVSADGKTFTRTLEVRAAP